MIRYPLRVQAAAAAVIAAGSTAAWAVFGGPFWPRWVWFGLAIVLGAQIALRQALRTPAGRRRWFAIHTAVAAVVVPIEVVIWALTGRGLFWPAGVILVLAATLTVHAWALGRPPGPREQELRARIERLTRTRSGTLDAQAQELRRIERDLHGRVAHRDGLHLVPRGPPG